MENQEVVEKTYTEKELQSYADKRVTEAMKTARQKFENEKKEAERLASMSAEERFNEELSKREKELADREKAVMMLENKQAATAILMEKGLPISLVDLVLADTAEDMKTRIDALDKEFNNSVKAEIEKRLGGNTPKKVGESALTKEDVLNMPLAQQNEYYKQNPEAFKSLF